MRKKLFFILALLCTVVQGAWADDVNYIYYTVNADGKTITKHEDGTASSPTVLTSKLISDNEEDRLYDGWYVLNSTFSYGERIVISGDVHLMLKDDRHATERCTAQRTLYRVPSGYRGTHQARLPCETDHIINNNK